MFVLLRIFQSMSSHWTSQWLQWSCPEEAWLLQCHTGGGWTRALWGLWHCNARKFTWTVICGVFVDMIMSLRMFPDLLTGAGTLCCVYGAYGILQMLPFTCHRDFQCCAWICLTFKSFSNHCTSENYISCLALAEDEAHLFFSNFPLEPWMLVTNKWGELKQMPEN